MKKTMESTKTQTKLTTWHKLIELQVDARAVPLPHHQPVVHVHPLVMILTARRVHRNVLIFLSGHLKVSIYHLITLIMCRVPIHTIKL